MTRDDGSRVVKKGDWRYPRTVPEECGPQKEWVGYTEFYVKGKVDLEKSIKAWMVKKSSDEAAERDISPEEWPAWQASDGAEWRKVMDTGAVRVLDEEESASVEAAERSQSVITDFAIKNREEMETSQAARQGGVTEIQVVHTGRQRPRLAPVKPLCSYCYYGSGEPGTSTGGEPQVQDLRGRSPHRLHAVREACENGGSTVLSTANQRTTGSEAQPTD